MRFRNKSKSHCGIEAKRLNFSVGFKNHLLFENCPGCKMSAIPQGVFAARKVRQNNKVTQNAKIESKDDGKNYFYSKSVQEGMELTPLQYNSKLMNSIWGMYNRYSKHNFKKITEANGSSCHGGL